MSRYCPFPGGSGLSPPQTGAGVAARSAALSHLVQVPALLATCSCPPCLMSGCRVMTSWSPCVHHVCWGHLQCHQAELHPRGPGPDTAMSCYQCPASDWSIRITWPEYWPLIGCHTPIIILSLANTRPTFCSASNSWDNLDGMVAGSTLTTLPCRFNIITRYVGAAQRTPHQTQGPGSGFPAWLIM